MLIILVDGEIILIEIQKEIEKPKIHMLQKLVVINLNLNLMALAKEKARVKKLKEKTIALMEIIIHVIKINVFAQEINLEF